MPEETVNPDGGIVLAGPEDTKLTFSGPPQALAGTIPIQNTTPDKQKLRTLAVGGEALRGPAQIPLREVALAARLAPGEQARVPGTIQLDPHTPPGQYDFEVKLGSRTFAATAFVNEVVDLRVDPDSITIVAGSSSTYVRQFVARNEGNTPLALGARCEAPIFDSFDLMSSMLIGLSKASGSDDAGAMLKSMLREWGGLHAGTLVISREPVILGPGQQISAEATFELPAELKPLRHYRSSLQLYNATLSIDIYTSATAGKNATPKKPESSKKRQQ